MKMVITFKCPNRNELDRLNQDKLSHERSEILFDHIEQCAACSEIFGHLEDIPDDLGMSLAEIHPEDLDKARQAIEEDTLRETATSIWGRVSPLLQPRDQKPSLKIPSRLGQYEVTRLIDFGGMGEIYEAHHVRLKRPVAIKVILGYRQNDPDTHQHFLKEMETAGQLEHPNLVRAYDAWEHEGCLFLAQELLIGDSLQNLVNKGSFGGPKEIVNAVLGTCRALEQLHKKNFIHRDVKPGNIMRLEDGRIKLIDYGLAIAADMRRSAIRIGAGTMGYMSPEQAHGGHPIDHRTDIYATGRVLKYLLSKLLEPPKTKREKQLVEHLEALAESMTKLDPKDRFQSVHAVINMLEKLKKAIESKSSRSTTAGAAKKNKITPESKPIWPETSQEATETDSGMDGTDDPSVSPEPILQPVQSDDSIQAHSTRSRTLQTRGNSRSNRVYLVAGIIAVLVFMAAAWRSYELIFKTDRQTTVLVKNHKAGDVIQLTSEDGEILKVQLDNEPKFLLGPGTYKIALTEPDNRQISPGNLEVNGRDQLTVRIEDRPEDRTDDPNKPKTEPDVRKTAKNPPQKPSTSKPSSSIITPSPRTTELLAARKKVSEERQLPETLTISLERDPDFKMEFVLIPPGEFQMGVPESMAATRGSDPRWFDTSQPAHEVRITKPFYMSRYEVTQKQFRTVCGGGPTPVDGDGTQHPAIHVSWQHCVDYCNRMTDIGTNLPNGAQLRLPTEAEWEYACRAGTDTWYWMGNAIGPNQASLRIRGRGLTLEPIDAYEPNPFGLYHMHGNVMEWCSDWLSSDYYGSSPVDDPQGPGNGTEKVLRGGGLSNPPLAVTSFWRQGYQIRTLSRSIGFRPVIELKNIAP